MKNEKNLEFVKTSLIVVLLILYTGGIFQVLGTGGSNEGEPLDISNNNGFIFSLINRIFQLTGFFSIFLIKPQWKNVIDVVIKNKYILLFTIFTISSTFWSDSEKTLSYSISLLTTNLFALYLAIRYTLKEQLLLLAQAFTIIVFLGIVFVVLLPKYGTMGGIHAGAWRGVFSHKNDLGRMMVISTIVFLLQSIGYKKNRLVTYFGLIFSIIFLLMSKSSSSIGNLLIVVTIFVVLRTWRWRFEIMVPASIALVFIGSLFYVWYNDNSAILFASAGKDSSLSGRTEIWPLLFDMGLKRPWLGYGYHAFWRGFNGPSAEVWFAASWHPQHSHNGFLDLWLNLGSIGLIIFVLSFLANLLKGFNWLRYLSKTPDGFWPLLFMVFLVLSNLTETGLMKENDIFTLIYMTISYSLTILTSRSYDIIDGNKKYAYE